MTLFLAALLRPFILLVLLGCILLPIRYAIIKWWPEGRVKRLLLYRVD